LLVLRSESILFTTPFYSLRVNPIKSSSHLITAFFFYIVWAPSVIAANKWEGPTSGPKKQGYKRILFISQDSRNVGVSTLYRHFQSAIRAIIWHVDYIDGANNNLHTVTFLNSVTPQDYDAVVLGGIGYQDFQKTLETVHQKGIVLIGWHASERPGSVGHLVENITTKPEDVAALAVNYATSNSSTHIGAVIFNDSRFAIANAKTVAMKHLLMKCQRCDLLDIQDIPIGDVGNRLSNTMESLSQIHGSRWTHNFAINDVYFDDARGYLRSLNRLDVKNIAAGDGSFGALRRIKQGNDNQVASVIEPLDVQGWQLVDELNRAFAGQSPSGYISSPILADRKYLNRIKKDQLHSAAYKKIWYGKE
jgi:ribose transport system substrate-binding protein